ncbi:MAG: hypothetical protein ACJAYB_000046 [Psychromonas sp.]|jgi:hypothetical protein
MKTVSLTKVLNKIGGVTIPYGNIEQIGKTSINQMVAMAYRKEDGNVLIIATNLNGRPYVGPQSWSETDEPFYAVITAEKFEEDFSGYRGSETENRALKETGIFE